jgi:AcrR family transcriptional regulator
MKSRERMIHAAETLLRESGLSGAGIKQLVARSGAPVGSVYHFFPGGKMQIVTETLHLHSGKAVQLFQRAFGDTAVPLPKRLRALFQMAAKGFEAAGADKGCAIGCVTLDLRASDDSLRRVCDASFEEWVDEIASHMPWPDAETRRSFATMVVISLEGAFVLARARHNGDAFTTAGDWLARLAQSTGSVSTGEPNVSSPPAQRRSGNRRRRVSPSGARTRKA